jgi:hypothetical protein
MRAALGLPRRGSTLLWHKEEERTGTKALFDPLLHATTNRVSLSCGPRSIGRDHPVMNRGFCGCVFSLKSPGGWASAGLTRESILHSSPIPLSPPLKKRTGPTRISTCSQVGTCKHRCQLMRLRISSLVIFSFLHHTSVKSFIINNR